MKEERQIIFKIATEDSEFEHIFQLNYRIFVEEIPQYPPNPERRLIDRFHAENTYFIALDGDQLIGMLAARDKRPFSLDEKLGGVDPYIPPGRNICEVRLLAVEPHYRTSSVIQGLLRTFVEYGKRRHYNLAIISGTTRQQRLYRHMGFVPFGPLVGAHGAQFQPMYLTLENFDKEAPAFINVPDPSAQSPNAFYFLTGPVSIRPEIQAAMGAMPIPHRSDKFKGDLHSVKKKLCRLTGARMVEVLLGSGTLANDVIAAQLALETEPGMILSNGEFGSRLVDHARRAGLSFENIELEWGRAFDWMQITESLSYHPETRWLWAVICETSTGFLNNLSMLKEICAEKKIKLCLDCISAIGTVPVDLRDVYFASCVSGKGLGSFPGLAIVFYNHDLPPRPDRLPRYLDLGFCASQGGIPFTHSSNLLAALDIALRRYDTCRPFEEISKLAAWVRPRLWEQGLTILAPDAHASPAVLTIVLPKSFNSEDVGDKLRASGLIVGYQSEYLRTRNWIQICLMGECSREKLVILLEELGKIAVPVLQP